MSFYNTNKFSFTEHALNRARDRISKYKNLSNLEIQCKLNNLLSIFIQPDVINLKNGDKYFLLPSYETNLSDLYIICNNRNEVVTITRVSHKKFEEILN